MSAGKVVLMRCANDVVVVSGSPTALFCFYFAWQTKLWPQWWHSPEPQAVELRANVGGVVCSGTLTLHCRGEEYNAALSAGIAEVVKMYAVELAPER